MTAAPFFRYHPDPVATGSVEPSEALCDVCGALAGLRYSGPVYGRQVGVVCLRCIGSGAAADALGLGDGPADFADAVGVPADVPLAVVEEITRRTPGFDAWQDPRWLYHCADGAAYLGRIGWEQVQDDGEALESLRAETRDLGFDDELTEEWLTRMSPDGDITGHLFQCLHCGAHVAYSDAG